MNTYRIVALSPSETAQAVQTLKCNNDAEAILQAINFGLGRMQVWQGDRLITELREVPTEAPANRPEKRRAA